MSRRLQRTILVTLTVTESWTLIWCAPGAGETADVQEDRRSKSTCSISVAIIADETVDRAITFADRDHPESSMLLHTEGE